MVKAHQCNIQSNKRPRAEFAINTNCGITIAKRRRYIHSPRPNGLTLAIDANPDLFRQPVISSSTQPSAQFTKRNPLHNSASQHKRSREPKHSPPNKRVELCQSNGSLQRRYGRDEGTESTKSTEFLSVGRSSEWRILPGSSPSTIIFSASTCELSLACSRFETQDTAKQSSRTLTTDKLVGKLLSSISTFNRPGAVLGVFEFNEGISLASSSKVLWNINYKQYEHYRKYVCEWKYRLELSPTARTCREYQPRCIGSLNWKSEFWRFMTK